MLNVIRPKHMGIIICPGLLAVAASQRFWQTVQEHSTTDLNLNRSVGTAETVIFLPPDCPVYSPQHVLQAVRPLLTPEPWIWIGFSAGIVGGLGAARYCHDQFPVHAFIALDAWGVPLIAPFPIYHLSHDRWTHHIVAAFNTLEGSFFADPDVNHLDLWETPDRVSGWDCQRGCPPSRTNAATYIGQFVNFSSIS